MATDSNVESLLLRALASVGQRTVADAVGGDETLISRFASGSRGLHINQMGPALDAMRLKLVPSDSVSIPLSELEALRTLARKALGCE